MFFQSNPSMRRNSFPVIILASLFVMIVFACKHDPLNPVDPPIDPPIDPPTGVVCDPDSVYFQNQVLPILVSNCTEPGCHSAADHQEGVVLDSYQSLLSTVEHVTQNDWGENKLIRSLEETDLEDRMPQNKPPLSTEQINLIKTWVIQGALNNACNESSGGCDTIGGAKYATFIQPLVQTKCKGCHSGNNPQGGIKLTTYAEIQTLALNGKLYGSVTKSTGWMPKGGAKLDDCALIKLKTWIDAGAPEN
jgi:hypothetical protein